MFTRVTAPGTAVARVAAIALLSGAPGGEAVLQPGSTPRQALVYRVRILGSSLPTGTTRAAGMAPSKKR